jgi:adenine/guanine phosphoribosyltransferase-like PRPP-binding protein
MAIHTNYLETLLDPKKFNKALSIATKVLRTEIANGLKVDCLVFCGMSGAIFAPVLARRLKLPFLLVRKLEDREHTHSWHEVEGTDEFVNYVIVDDCVSTGATLKRIIKAVGKFKEYAILSAVVLYDEKRQTSWGVGCAKATLKRECGNEEIPIFLGHP